MMADSQQPTLFAEAAMAGNTADTTTDNRHSKRPKKVKEPLTSKQQLSSIIKSVRDDLRKDAGLSGDTDRLPQLTWLLFLKSLNDFEEAYQEMLGDDYVPAIEAPYRWRDWADIEDKAERMTGDILLEFVNNELIPYLARLSGPDERDIRTIIGTIFQGTSNRIRSGYILRQVVDRISGINFTLSDDAHAVSHFYETMLKEMRDAAGDSGEFYTPRPVVRFIINRLQPKLGERIMDPACGTAGFLVEAYEQLKGEVRTPDQRRMLEDSLIGIEKKPMPYLLGVMNMRLHGIEAPHLSERNALAMNVRQIRDAERVDVIATNPPFGGAEEQGILNNFPDGFRTAETAILFFQYVMALLKRPGGRCGVVLPNGFLFGNGVAATVKKQLLTRFNLHTIVRLPNGAFAPYTSIPTNLLFFEACEYDAALEGDRTCTKEVWYYEVPLPEGRSSYSKTKPLQYEEFADCIAWWDNRIENEHAWKVPVEQLLANDCNLDVKNPHSKKDLEHLPAGQLVETILGSERHVIKILEERDWSNLKRGETAHSTFPLVQLSELLLPVSRPEPVIFENTYPILGARWYAKGLYIKDIKLGSEIQADKVYRVEEGDFVYNRLFAWKGSFAVATKEDNGCYVSNEFPCFKINTSHILGEYLLRYFSRASTWDIAFDLSSGGTPTSRNRLKEEKLLQIKIPLPPLDVQQYIVTLAAQIEEAIEVQQQTTKQLDALLYSVLNQAFQGDL